MPTPQQRFKAITKGTATSPVDVIVPVSDEILPVCRYEIYGKKHVAVVRCAVVRHNFDVENYVIGYAGHGDWLFVNQYEENGFYFWVLERQVR